MAPTKCFAYPDVGSPWMFTLAFGHHEDRAPTHCYAETREAADGGWRREGGASL
jgi:hypothetical protein